MDPSMIQNDVCVEANVKVSPDVKIKNIQTFFVGEPVVESCAQNAPESSYAVSQMLCIKYFLSFSADVQAAPAAIICNPQEQECSYEQDYPDVQAGPSVTVYEQEAQESEQQSSADPQTYDIKRPGPKDRFADRKISISKYLYETVFSRNLAFRYRRY